MVIMVQEVQPLWINAPVFCCRSFVRLTFKHFFNLFMNMNRRDLNLKIDNLIEGFQFKLVECEWQIEIRINGDDDDDDDAN